jgi:hypothetical protein
VEIVYIYIAVIKQKHTHWERFLLKVIEYLLISKTLKTCNDPITQHVSRQAVLVLFSSSVLNLAFYPMG